ncbi:hypothetical protein DY000_02021319 [Brassica cretica]|uniref:Uncharacterized protein n=1 Tax=Brassica cretica TaxID=69181 RepID=A0ABQ7EB00_BRACR|nr:hypothetical protein DY000_02021319 [Brassica cretica]
MIEGILKEDPLELALVRAEAEQSVVNIDADGDENTPSVPPDQPDDPWSEHGLMSYRCLEGFNRYTATELRLEPGCYVATERDERSVATW